MMNLKRELKVSCGGNRTFSLIVFDESQKRIEREEIKAIKQAQIDFDESQKRIESSLDKAS